jgi:hypothetical protein
MTIALTTNLPQPFFYERRSVKSLLIFSPLSLFSY